MNTSTLKSSDRFIPYYIATFFLFLTMALGWFIWIAVHNYSGEVPGDAYQQGVTYNRTLAAEAEQVRQGWQGEITPVANGQDVTLSFTLADKQGHPITDATAIATFVRETQAGYDQKISLHTNGNGVYEGKVPLPLKGEWRVQVSATSNGHNYQQVKNIEVQ